MMERFALMLWLQLISSTTCIEYSDIYNFPMFGILQYKYGSPPHSYTTYGSVTIAHTKMVIAAAENLCQLDPSGKSFIFRDDLRGNLFVTVASDLMEPPDAYENQKVKRIKVDFVYFGKSSKFTSAMNDTSLKRATFVKLYETDIQPSPSLQGKEFAEIDNLGFVRNPFGELQWDIALLTLTEALQWGPYILPIPDVLWHQDNLWRNFDAVWSLVESAEQHPHQYPPCIVPGWSAIGNNEVVYHKVVYIRFKECAEAICGAYPSSCLQYLNARHHLCFKSLTFSDSCIVDQGAPVLCTWAKNHVLGILVKTWDCGAEGLPTVFTRVDIIAGFAKLLKDESMSVAEPKYGDPKYTLAPIG